MGAEVNLGKANPKRQKQICFATAKQIRYSPKLSFNGNDVPQQILAIQTSMKAVQHPQDSS
jgi:hypothetical protein